MVCMAVYHDCPRKSYYAGQKCSIVCVSYSTSPFSARLSVQYRPLILHMLSASVHHAFVNSCEVATNLKLFYPGQ